jgi:rod shape determining protein RodA
MTSPTMRADRRLNPRTDPLSPWFHIDIVLVLASVALALFGAALIYSATRGPEEPYDTFYLERQGMFLILGAGLAVGAATISYHSLRKLAFWGLSGSLLGVLATYTPLGVEVNGAKNWLGAGSFQLQPSEFAKIGLILVLATYLPRFDGVLNLKALAGALVIAGVPLVLVLGQPDLGTGLVYIVILMAMCLLGGIRTRHAVLLTVLGVLFASAVIQSPLLEDYQRERLTTFLDPDDTETDAGYQQHQSQLAIGHGGLTGTGFGEGSQTRGEWVPESHTDFIFTVVGEEFGLLGSVGLLGLFGVIMWRVWRTAALASDQFGSLICVGVLAMLVFQLFQAVGMTIGIMPITGLPIPLVSYGGSSALTTLASLGLVVNVHMRRHQPVPRRRPRGV